jgi:hypothetical protein
MLFFMFRDPHHVEPLHDFVEPMETGYIDRVSLTEVFELLSFMS